MAGEKILIIEDEQDIALMLETMMRDCGYLTSVAYDGLSGLEQALKERPELILLDLRLPRMSGIQLLSQLQEQQVNVPVVVVTAWGSEELALHALRMGVKDYIKKPFSFSELLEVVEGALEEGRLRRERDILTQQLLVFNQQLKQRVRELTALYEVGQALAATLDLNELLDVTLKEACRVLKVEIASIMLLDEQSGELVFRSGTGGMAERLVDLRLSPGQGIAGWVAENNEPLLVPEVQSDPRFTPAFDQITGITTESLLCVPLMVKGRTIGVVEAMNKPPPGFTEDDLALLRSMATSMAVAIENSQLFKETKRRLRESKVLLHLGKQLTALLPLIEMLDIVVKGAIELVPKAQRSIIYLCERGKSGDTLRAGAGSTASLSPWDIIWEPTIKRRIVGRALREHRTIQAHVPHVQTRQDDLAAPFSWILAVPLRVQEEDLGVLTVDSQSAAFTDEEENLLTTFANQAAIAVKSARLHRQTEVQLTRTTQAYSEIRALQKTTGALLSSLELQEVLDQIVNSVVSGLNYSAAMLAEYDEQENALPVRAIAADPSLVKAGEGLLGLRALETGVSLDQTDSLAVRAALSGEIHTTHDLYELFLPWVTPEQARTIQAAAGIRTLATIPLQAKGRLVGNLFAGSSKKELSETDLDSLQTLANQAAIAIENARLYQDLRESRDQVAERSAELEKLLNKLVRLQRISLALGKLTIGADLREVYERLTEHAATLLEANSSAILLFDPEREELVCQAPAFGVSDELIRNYTIPLGPDSPAWKAWEDGHPLVINDVNASPMVKQLGVDGLARQQGVRSTMLAMMRISGRSVGVFQVSDKLDGNDFTPDDQRVLEIFASQCAIAIENARLLASEKHRASEMETLVEIAQAVTEAVTERPRALLERIARNACEMLHADCAVVYPFDLGEPGQPRPTPPDTYDVSNVATFGTLHRPELGDKIPNDDPVHLVREFNPLICEDIAREHPSLLKNPFFKRESIQAFVGVLLKADEKELGVLYVNYCTPQRFQERDLIPLRLIAHQTALAIAKSRLFETLNRDLVRTNADLLRKLHEMEELQKISNLISSTLEIDKVFDGILEGAMSITGAPQVNILMMDEESDVVISRMRIGDRTVIESIDPADVTLTSPQNQDFIRWERPSWQENDASPEMAESQDNGMPWSSIYRRLIPDARSFLYVPIMSGSGKERLGLLGIGSPHPGEFGRDDRRLLEALANQAAIAIQNAHYLQTVRVYQEQQVEAERIAAIADVAGNMVHRINNTVGAIRPLIQQIEMKLAQGKLDEDYLREKLRGIRQSANHTLEVARQIRRPFQSAPLQPVDVNEAIAAAWSGLKTPVGVEVKIECKQDLPLVQATRQLEEVFRNLMKNALDAMEHQEQKGLLVVHSRQLNDRQVEVTVQDNGPGIPPELRAKIFQMGITTKPGGMGYGLWWSRMFLRRLGGDMELESEEGKGCLFTVTLPTDEAGTGETHNST